MTKKQLVALITKYLAGEADEEEKRWVEDWYESHDAHGLEFAHNEQEGTDSMARSLQKIRQKITTEPLEAKPAGAERKGRIKVLYGWAAVAAIAVVVIGVAYFFTRMSPGTEPVSTLAVKEKDIQPGGTKATLILGNGKRIVLDTSTKGTLYVQGNTQVVKLTAGTVVYNVQPSGEPSTHAGNPAQRTVQFNTITTPPSGKYEVVLADGSKIWLNAGSSLTFPTAFTGQNREVEMTGEVYFEIAKDAGKPFIVKKGSVEIQVLGTQFDVMAYDNEADMKITLLQGLVKVAKQSVGGGQLLKPGQQAAITHDGAIRLVTSANLDQVVAWKNNLFWFENDDIAEVARTLSRWYNVDIQIEGNIPDKFTGSIPMDLPFSVVFGMLQKTGRVTYRMTGANHIVFSP